MGFINWIKGVISKMFKSEVKDQFGVTGITSGEMQGAIQNWMNIYRGNPDWVDVDTGTKTIKFAKAVCSETARLTNLALDIQFDGRRADYMQQWFEKAVMPKLRNWVEYGCACGTVILKPNGTGVDFVLPGSFEIVNKDGNGCITGVVFQDSYQEDDIYYTKLEYHRFMKADVRMSDSEKYVETTYYSISNRAYASKNAGEIGKMVDLASTKWANLKPDVSITKKNGEKLESMLFGVFRMPASNDIDLDSPLGMAIFSDALEELKDLDIAYSRNSEEIDGSSKIVLLDERLINLPATKDAKGNIVRRSLNLPKYVKNVNALDDAESFYQEINPELNTDVRIKGINNQLSFIGCKCGYSNGYFVFDQKTGMVTATQVEADDRRTIQLIKDIRDSLQNCLNDLFYAQSVFADLYHLAPVGEYEVNYSFGDITYNFEEDKMHHYQLACQGKYPWEEYYVEYLHYSREDARRLIKLAQEENKQDSKLFGNGEE